VVGVCVRGGLGVVCVSWPALDDDDEHFVGDEQFVMSERERGVVVLKTDSSGVFCCKSRNTWNETRKWGTRAHGVSHHGTGTAGRARCFVCGSFMGWVVVPFFDRLND
jgi:hypothetical protein